MRKDLHILKKHFEDKGYKSMKFKSIAHFVNPRFTEEYLLKMIEYFPDDIRRCTFEDNLFGIKFLRGL